MKFNEKVCKLKYGGLIESALEEWAHTSIYCNFDRKPANKLHGMREECVISDHTTNHRITIHDQLFFDFEFVFK